MLTGQQVAIVIGVPLIFNATLSGLLIALANARFDGINKRFDDMRDLWRAELRRVEEVFDSRLKQLEHHR